MMKEHPLSPGGTHLPAQQQPPVGWQYDPPTSEGQLHVQRVPRPVAVLTRHSVACLQPSAAEGMIVLAAGPLQALLFASAFAFPAWTACEPLALALHLLQVQLSPRKIASFPGSALLAALFVSASRGFVVDAVPLKGLASKFEPEAQ